MCKTPKDKSAEIAEQAERERQARVRAGTAEIDKTFSSFNDDYYDGIAKSYAEHYTPQLDQQYADARKAIMYNPAGGSTNSSAFAQQLAKLEADRQKQLVEIGNRGMSEAQGNRANVASNRQNLIQQLNAGSSVESVAGLAAENARNLTAPPVYSPLGDLFARYTANAANAVNAGVLEKQQIDPLLFGGTNKSAVRTVGF
jgi:23S rRNA pseudoU1915 N3-methylase RlmH